MRNFILLLVFITLLGTNTSESTQEVPFPKTDVGLLMRYCGDIRLQAIAENPCLFEKLDQKVCFKDEKVYNEILKMSLIKPRDLLPKFFSEDDNTLYSACPGDNRLFIFSEHNEFRLIAWVPLQVPTIHFSNNPAGDYGIFWIIPKFNKPNILASLWNEVFFQRADKENVSNIFRKTMNIKISDEKVEEQLQLIKTSIINYGEKHNLEILFSKSLMQLSLELYTDLIKKSNPSMPAPEFWIKENYGIEIPFKWPPDKNNIVTRNK